MCVFLSCIKPHNLHAFSTWKFSNPNFQLSAAIYYLRTYEKLRLLLNVPTEYGNMGCQLSKRDQKYSQFCVPLLETRQTILPYGRNPCVVHKIETNADKSSSPFLECVIKESNVNFSSFSKLEFRCI